MNGPQFETLTSSDIPLPLVLNSCGEFVGLIRPHSAEKVGAGLLPPDAAPSRAKAAPGRRSNAVAARATALQRIFELFMARSIGAVRCTGNRTLVLGPLYAAGSLSLGSGHRTPRPLRPGRWLGSAADASHRRGSAVRGRHRLPALASRALRRRADDA